MKPDLRSEVLRVSFRIEEAAVALGVSPRWLADRVKEHRVPHARIGGVVLFGLKELTEFVSRETERTMAACQAEPVNDS